MHNICSCCMQLLSLPIAVTTKLTIISLVLQVEQSGRLPSHTFLDYSLTYLAFAAASALTLGQLGPPAVSPLGQSLQFLDQLRQDNWQMVLFALAGGTCLAFGGKATAMAASGLAVLLVHRHQVLSKCTAFRHA